MEYLASIPAFHWQDYSGNTVSPVSFLLGFIVYHLIILTETSYVSLNKTQFPYLFLKMWLGNILG